MVEVEYSENEDDLNGFSEGEEDSEDDYSNFDGGTKSEVQKI